MPVEDMAELGAAADPQDDPRTRGADRLSIWPSIHPVLLELIRAHRSTIVFVNNRRSAERLSSRLNDLAEEDLVRAHHGSIARDQRILIEDGLKEGRLRAIVATSSLELGIDMGAVDLVVQVESPDSVASGLQRIGRAGHQVGAPSVGKLIPKYRGDLLQTAVVAERMLAADIEATRYPRNPLDVLAQQLVAMTAVEEWRVEDLYAAVRACANFADLSRDVFTAVLDLLAGRYPSDAFAGLRPRVVWDRAADTVRAREGAGRIAITSGGTIPDRGLFGVFMPDGTRVGELDEEMRLRVPPRRGDPARRERVADRGHHARPRRRQPGPGRTGQAAVLEGARPGQPDRARPRDRAVHARAPIGGARRRA